MSKKTLERPFNKAGVLLYGWVKDAHGVKQLHMLTTYTEGRFSDDGHKCYDLPRGSIDPNESAMATAFREMQEETGINPHMLFGEEGFSLFCGHQLVGARPSGYAGVRIVQADPIPMSHTYLSGHGATHRAAFYAIEVDGIEHLMPYLKQKPALSGAANFGAASPTMHTTAATHAKHEHLPGFKEMITILRTGKVPARAGVPWAHEQSATEIIKKPVLKDLEVLYPPTLGTHTLAGLVDFCRRLPGDEYKRLVVDFEKVAQHFKKQGAVGDAGDKLKLDTQDRPMNLFQEGAEILPASVLLERVAAMAANNPLYARTVCGDYQGKRRMHADPVTRMVSAQIAPFVQLVSLIAPEVQLHEKVEAGKSNDGADEYRHRMDDTFGDAGAKTHSFIERIKQAAATTIQQKKEASGRS